MDLLAEINHPAQVHLFRPVLEECERKGYSTAVVARDKDLTLSLLDTFGIPYTILAPIGRGVVGRTRELLQREWAMLRTVRKCRPGIITGSSVNGVRVAKLFGCNSVVLCEDDAKYIPQFRWLAYPLATAIVTPDVLAYENYGTRHLTYPSFQKLFYLHPNRFTPDRSILGELGVGEDEPFAIIRLSSLQAHHDIGARGMSEEMIREVIRMTRDRARVFITSEKPLAAEFEPHRLPIAPHRIHHALHFAEFFISDSQSMTVEAALLGTPAFKINTFAGIISVIRELEESGLAFGYRPGEETALLRQLETILRMDDMNSEFRRRQRRLLARKIDPLPWYMGVVDRLLAGEPIAGVKAWSTQAADDALESETSDQSRDR